MDVIVKGQPSIEIGFETKVIQVGGLGDIDSSLSTESENPVMNKVITVELNNKADKGEVTAALNTKADKNETDTKLTELSTETEAIHTELDSQNELIEDLQNTKIDKEADDYYPQLAVGLADNLAGVDVVDSEINFRRSGGGAISDGVARIEAIKGNSVVWNQKYPDDFTFTMYGVTSTSINGLISIEGTVEKAITQLYPFTANELNHKYLFVLSGTSSQMEGKRFQLHNRNTHSVISGGFAYLFHENTDASSGRYFGLSGFSVGDVISENNIRVNQYDLTQMFGAGNEPTTIEEFYSRIPMGVDLNAYNEGEVIHMDVQSIKSQGVNAWDEEWEQGLITDKDGKDKDSAFALRSNAFRVLPNAMYYVYMSKSDIYIKGFFYDNQMNFIGNGDLDSNGSTSFTVPSNAYYLRLRLYKGSDKLVVSDAPKVCINISDTSINGKYFPYIKRVEDLSIIRNYFPQGMKSAGTAHDEIRYNKATQKWEYSKEKIKEVDLGTLNWFKTWYTENEQWRIYANLPSKVKGQNNLLTKKYVTSYTDNGTMSDISITGNKPNSYIYIKDSSYSAQGADALIASLQGVILYYESNDWEWVELDAEDQFKDLDYQVWNCGTEKAIAEGKSAPLAADITYGFNAIGKIKELESLVAQLRAKVGI